MKKLLSFIFLLFIPFMVNAEVKIKDAVLVDNTEGLEVEKNPHHEGLQLDINMKLSNVGEFAKYKLTIANDTKKDYEIDMGEAFSKKEYIKYEFSFVEDDNAILKANESKDIYVLVTYNKEVPENEFVNGVYKDDNVMTINLSTEEEQVNPNTKTGYAILATAVLLFISLLLILLNKYKLDHLMVLVIAIAVTLPISIYALEKITIKIQAQIEIESAYRQIRVLSCHFEEDEPNGYSSHIAFTDDVFKVKKDMTLNGVRQNPTEFVKLNPNAPEFLININTWYVYPLKFYTCVSQVPMVEWKPNMTQQEIDSYNAYKRNLFMCEDSITEDDYEGNPEDYDFGNPLLPMNQAVYYGFACQKFV